LGQVRVHGRLDLRKETGMPSHDVHQFSNPSPLEKVVRREEKQQP